MLRFLLTSLLTLTSLTSGFAKEGAVECGNLIYAGNKTSRCFSDEFLSSVQQKTSIATSRRFRAVRLDNEELFRFPFVVMTGEGDFTLTTKERENLKKYTHAGGFLLASAGCSNEEWNNAFRKEIRLIFGAGELKPIDMKHAIFSTIFPIKKLDAEDKPTKAKLEGVTFNNKLVIVYSADGLNDSSNSKGCCCCGGSELRNALKINANILAYALLR